MRKLSVRFSVRGRQMVLGGYLPGDFGGMSLTCGRDFIPAAFLENKNSKGCMLRDFQGGL